MLGNYRVESSQGLFSPSRLRSPASCHGPLSGYGKLTACVPWDPIAYLAPTWHHGYVAWEKRERRRQDDTDKLEADQCRLFGGEPGDDVGLCYRMLEYFGGLDYIDS